MSVLADPFPMDTAQEKRRGYLQRWTRLKADRSDWVYHWDELGRHIKPRSFRFFKDDRNRGGKWRYGSILDNTPTQSLRVLSAGIMSNMTSPGRPWFKLRVRDPELSRQHDVQLWLDEVTERMQFVFSKSNFYRALPKLYDDLGCFGTGAMLMLSNFDRVIHCYHLTMGEFCLGQNWEGVIDTCYREFQRTVKEVVEEFGKKNVSLAVLNAYKNRDFDQPVNILHVVEPRSKKDRDMSSPLSRDMPFKSVYLELDGEENKLLRESGFRRMRVLAPRWIVDGNDVYGGSPGMDALGDIRQLNQQEFRKAQAIDYKARPPLQIPAQMRGKNSRLHPGGVNYYEPGMLIPHDQSGPHGGIRPAFEVRLDIRELHENQGEVRNRIKSAFFVDLFLMFAGIGEQARMTIPEVLERQGEKLLMIGPTVERLDNDLLEPAIDITFWDMAERGLIPPPPPALAGVVIEVEFTSILAQAQRAIGITGIQQWVQDNMSVANVRPDVIDNINFDEWSRRTAQMRGVPAALVVAEGEVEQLRRARAEAEAAQAQIDAANTQADTAQKLALAPVNQGSALDAAMDTLNGTPDEA